MRAGQTMDEPLRYVCKEIPLGKLLIQTNDDSFEPEVGERGHV